MYIAFDNLICAIYGIPSLVIYVSMLFCLLSIRKTLHKSTTFIYLTAAIVNFVTFFQVWTTIRLLDERWFFWYYEMMNDFGILPTFQKFLSGYVHYAQDTVTLLMAVDRFYVICNVRHLEKWQNLATLFGFALFGATFVLHAVLHFDVSRDGARFVYHNNTEYYSLHAYTRTGSNKSSLGQAIVGTTFLIGCAALNFRSILRLRCLYAAHKKIEVSFFAIAFFTFIAQVANVAILWFFVYIYFISYNSIAAGTTREISAYALDAISLGPGLHAPLSGSHQTEILRLCQVILILSQMFHFEILRNKAFLR